LNHPGETPEFPSPSIADSRRLLGPNLHAGVPGAVLEVECDHSVVPRWRDVASAACESLGWPSLLRERLVRGGASLFLAAPVDSLMAATEVNEEAFAASERNEALAPEVLQRLEEVVATEQRRTKGLRELTAFADDRGLSWSLDDELLTVGSGKGSRSWQVDQLPRVTDVAWDELTDVPMTLVTGSNGKTTTTRLVARMWTEAGFTTGWTCSDGVWIGEDQLESGDYSGPAGARAVIRDPRVQAAVLESARGGMLRRGLAVNRARAAIITNISADHFGEYGVESLGDLADVKGIVARALGRGGTLVLNADDPELRALAERVDARVAWFSLERADCLAGILDGRLVVEQEGRHDLGGVEEFPLTFGGNASHNVENVVAAAALGVASGVPLEAIRRTLSTFGSRPEDNPGRLQILEVAGFSVMVDYAHNPDGLAALCSMADHLPARRRLLLLGQAGNRDDEQLRELVRSAVNSARFDHVVIKEIPSMLKGRPSGQIPEVFMEELQRLGVTADRIDVAENELEALRRALDWAQPGDLLVCPVHVEKRAAMELLREYASAGRR
jgi:cyanophycin synthetase